MPAVDLNYRSLMMPDPVWEVRAVFIPRLWSAVRGEIVVDLRFAHREQPVPAPREPRSADHAVIGHGRGPTTVVGCLRERERKRRRLSPRRTRLYSYLIASVGIMFRIVISPGVSDTIGACFVAHYTTTLITEGYHVPHRRRRLMVTKADRSHKGTELESSNVKTNPVIDSDWVGTAIELLRGLEKTDTTLANIRVGTDIGAPKIELWGQYAGMGEPTDIPAKVHSQLTDWGYEHADGSYRDDRRCHVYIKK
jgi:hypothetical protein